MTRSNGQNLSSELSAYLDGELSPPRAKEVEAWLASSPEARALLDDLRAVRDQLANLPRVEAPAELHAQVRELIARRGAPVATDHDGGVPSRTLWRIATRITGVAAVILAGVFAWWQVADVGLPAVGPAAPVAPVPADSRSADEKLRASPEVARGGAVNEDLAVAIAQEDERQRTAEPPRVAIVTPEELANLQALGYAGGDSDAEDAAHELDDIMGQPLAADAGPAAAPPVVVAAPEQPAGAASARGAPTATVLGAESAVDAPAARAGLSLVEREEVPDGVVAKIEGESPVTDAAPGPDVRVIVQATDQAHYDALVHSLSAWRVLSERSASPDRATDENQDEQPSYALTLESPAIGKLLRMLDAQAPERVQVAMLFRPQDMAVAGDLLRSNALAADPDPNMARAGRMRRERLRDARRTPTAAGRRFEAYESPAGGAMMPAAPRAAANERKRAKDRNADERKEKSTSRPIAGRGRRGAGELRPFGDEPDDKRLAEALATLEELGVDTTDLTPRPPVEALVFGPEFVGGAHVEYTPAFHCDPNDADKQSENAPAGVARERFSVRVAIVPPPPVESQPADAPASQPRE